jgi:hypothetical protein
MLLWKSHCLRILRSLNDSVQKCKVDRFGAIKYCRYDFVPKLTQNKSVSLLSKKERGNDNHVKRSSPVDQKRGREA